MKNTALTVFTIVAVLLLVATTLVAAQDEQEQETGEPSHETQFVDDDADIDYVGGKPLTEDANVGPGGEVEIKLPQECDADPNSDECKAEKDRLIEPEQRLKEDEAQMKEFDKIVSRLEVMSNVWACAACGLPLFQVPGDKDVFNYGWHLLSQSFLDAGQTYGSQLVTQFHRSRSLPGFTCENVEHQDATEYDGLANGLLEMKEGMVKWLSTNEVEAGEIISNFFNNFRGTYGTWGVVRLLLQNKSDKDTGVPEDAVFAVLPLLKTSDGDNEDLCMVGGQLHTMYLRSKSGKSPVSAKMETIIGELLDGCLKNGRVSRKPQTYGQILMTAGRDEQARELFDVATQRGVLCHPLQRPENEGGHHKALSASPFWTLEDFQTEVRQPLNDLVIKVNDDLENFQYAGVDEMMKEFIDDESSEQGGEWERTTIFGNNQWNTSLVSSGSLSNATLDHIKETLDVLIDSNDGYAFGCNGSTVVEVWRMFPPLQTRKGNGATNIVLQLIAPLNTGSGHQLLVTAGDESMVLEEGESGILDDTFENTLKVEAGPSTSNEPLVLLHVQLCHPEMHDKAMTLNHKRCPRKRD